MGLKPNDKTEPFDYGSMDDQGLHENYPILPDAQRVTLVRPVRQTYRHLTCGVVTTMALGLAETYAADPQYYTHTYCAGCRSHLPVGEFIWDTDGQPVGS